MARRKKEQNSAPPQTEIDLQRLQERYLSSDCTQAERDEFFLLMKTYARSMTLKMIKSKGIFIPPERVEEISTDATLVTLNQYSKPGWKISASFAGQLRFKILEVMYGQAEDEKNSSLNFTFTEDNDSKEIIDIVGTGACLPWQVKVNQNVEDNPIDDLLSQVNVAYDVIKDLIDEAYKDLPYNTFIKFLPWLLLQLRKPKTRNIETSFEKLFLNTKEVTAFEILLLEVRNRISEHVF